MTDNPTPENDSSPPPERRSAARPTRRREPLVPPDLEPSERRLPAMASRRRYRGPLRRRDDRPEGTGDGGAYQGDAPGRGPREDRLPDHRLEEDICALLTRHPEVDAAEIEVMVEGGEVTLQGSVAQRDACWLIEELVAAVPGVSLVHNRVRVAGR